MNCWKNLSGKILVKQEVRTNVDPGDEPRPTKEEEPQGSPNEVKRPRKQNPISLLLAVDRRPKAEQKQMPLLKNRQNPQIRKTISPNLLREEGQQESQRRISPDE
jgi:hypothetical protein